MFATLILAAALSAAPEPAPSADCTWENARKISVETLERSNRKLVGQCVRVRGDLSATRLSNTRSSGVSSEVWTGVGAYFQSAKLMEQVFGWEEDHRVEVLGAVGHCTQVYDEMKAELAENPDAVFLPTGWCHFYADPLVRIKAIRGKNGEPLQP